MGRRQVPVCPGSHEVQLVCQVAKLERSHLHLLLADGEGVFQAGEPPPRHIFPGLQRVVVSPQSQQRLCAHASGIGILGHQGQMLLVALQGSVQELRRVAAAGASDVAEVRFVDEHFVRGHSAAPGELGQPYSRHVLGAGELEAEEQLPGARIRHSEAHDGGLVCPVSVLVRVLATEQRPRVGHFTALKRCGASWKAVRASQSTKLTRGGDGGQRRR
eukprot:scaffold5189_cov275-Pinguiococcus_pyrenoidosus.AAC.2